MSKKIGTGKFSVVYEAVNKETKSQVAIKVIDYKELDYAARKMIAYFFLNFKSLEQHYADFLPSTFGSV